MKSKFFSILFLSLILVSCKKEQEKQVEGSYSSEPIFNISIDIKIMRDDDLIIYYKDGTNEWIVEDKAVWNSVKGSKDFQTVTFSMPEGVLPNDFRIDIGRNEFKDQEAIEIKKVVLSYLNSKFEINQDQINMFFKPNQYIIFDQDLKSYSFSKDKTGNYDPYFETTSLIYPELTNVVLKQ